MNDEYILSEQNKKYYCSICDFLELISVSKVEYRCYVSETTSTYDNTLTIGTVFINLFEKTDVCVYKHNFLRNKGCII